MGPRFETGGWSERKRLIRFRRQREHLRFSEEIKLVPQNLIIGTLAALAALILLAMAMCSKDFPAAWNVADDLGRGRATVAVGLIGVAMAIPIAIIVLLTAYVYRDARRRGMNAGLWTLLVLIMLPCYIAMGYILYFTAREPLPYPCPKCRATVSARFNFCPTCKYELHRSCAQCRREVGENDRYCPHCGHDQAAVQALQQV